MLSLNANNDAVDASKKTTAALPLSPRAHLQAWRYFRREFLWAHQMCEVCDEKPAQEVHHIEPVAANPDREFDDTNCQAVCRRCHKNLHRHSMPKRHARLP